MTTAPKHECDPDRKLGFGSYCPACGEPQSVIYGTNYAAWRRGYDLGFAAGKAEASLKGASIA